MTRFMSLLLLALGALSCADAGPIAFKHGVYDGLVVGIDEDLPALHCAAILANLEVAISTASATLRTALDGRATIGQTVVLIPDSWGESCLPPLPGIGPDGEAAKPTVVSSMGETPDITVMKLDPAFGSNLFTQQSRGCGQPGDQVYLGSTLLEEPFPDLGRRLAREFAKYRYGVFDESGIEDDPIYPICHRREPNNRLSLTGCSDLPLEGEHTACATGTNHANLSELVQPSSHSSLMFAPSVPHVDHFCDEHTHDRLAPTKQNAFCGRRSVMEVINLHDDFRGSNRANASVPVPPPSFVYKRATLTRYMLVVEDSKDMSIRDTWTFLRTAVRKWANLDLTVNTEVGLLVVNESSSAYTVPLQAISGPDARSLISSNIPYTAAESHAPVCLSCAVRKARELMKERERLSGPASSVIILVGCGTDNPADLKLAAMEAAADGVRVATITYPAVIRSSPLDIAASVTDTLAFIIEEKGYSMAMSMLGAYFRLTTALFDITTHFYVGHLSLLPIEVHRRALNDLSKDLTGSFVMEEGMGTPSRFGVYAYDTENPLLRNIFLVSPSHKSYSLRTEQHINVRMLSLATDINETGTWQYKIERFRGNPQPHFVQVVASARSPLIPVVRARFYTSKGKGPLVLYVQVTYGHFPVLGASVEVTITRPNLPGQPGQPGQIAQPAQLNQTNTTVSSETFLLLDTGAGDPDLMRGDGIYSRYFSTLMSGAGTYTFHVTVTDNGHTAYSWKENRQGQHSPVEGYGSCCGSELKTPAQHILPPFQRILPPLTMVLGDSASMLEHDSPFTSPGRVGNLRVEVLGGEPRARLTWTSPDFGGLEADRYEIKYSTQLRELIDAFDTQAQTWEHGFPPTASPGKLISFTLDVSLEPSLLDTHFYVAMRAYPEEDVDLGPGPVSNWVRVFVKSPPPVVTTPTSVRGGNDAGGHDMPPWDMGPEGEDGPDQRVTGYLEIGLDIIIPVIGGVLLLVICLGVYCYLCVVRRETPRAVKINHNNGAPGGGPPRPPATCAEADNSPCFEQKRRLDVDDAMDMHAQPGNHSGGHPSPTHSMPATTKLSLIPFNTGNIEQKPVSPFGMWSASELLGEHDRRVNPDDDEHALPAYHIQYQYQPYHHQHTQLPQHAVDGRPPQYDQQYYQEPHSPPVPPLPHLHFEEDAMYGVRQQCHPQPHPQQGFLQNNRAMAFNPSLQGSLSSVNSDRKKRNVTMV
ncbi:calcium-activated chloride channel regulator 2-like [Thrips palmi]|uniref:Calcium-activated chloride channel regulator 2-like n=1 Tax=Thrips palmi TaxID=161013 RepID=A0A6P8ZY36_THRPL|nr:calcium-activated chloride channel regulator 2-like [Thrips palmi]